MLRTLLNIKLQTVEKWSKIKLKNLKNLFSLKIVINKVRDNPPKEFVPLTALKKI